MILARFLPLLCHLATIQKCRANFDESQQGYFEAANGNSLDISAAIQKSRMMISQVPGQECVCVSASRHYS